MLAIQQQAEALTTNARCQQDARQMIQRLAAVGLSFDVYSAPSAPMT